jgi:hypothetical protein
VTKLFAFVQLALVIKLFVFVQLALVTKLFAFVRFALVTKYLLLIVVFRPVNHSPLQGGLMGFEGLQEAFCH